MQYHHARQKAILRNHSTALPRYLIALDCETNRQSLDATGQSHRHTFRLASAIACRLRGTTPTGIKWHKLTHQEQFFELLESYTSIRHTTWVLAHNCLFDFVIAGLPEQLERGKLSLSWPRQRRSGETVRTIAGEVKALAVIESPPTIIACKVGSTQGRVVFVDSMNWFPESLAKLGEAIGRRKLPMPDFDASDEEWFQYNFRDTEILFRVFVELIQWVKENDFGMFRYTAPSQSMAAFRHKFMDHKISLHELPEVTKLERQSYFGGRTECFHIGRVKENVHQLDVSSLFPSVMQVGYFPTCLNRYEISTEWKYRLPDIEWHNSVAEVEIVTERDVYPVRLSNKTIYPVGRFTTSLCGEELADAFYSGAINAIKSFAEYRTERIFSRFVGELWQMRQQYKQTGNKLYEQFVKRFLNSLYGKFGQLSPVWVNIDSDLSAVPWSKWSSIDKGTGIRTDFRSFGWQVQKKADREEIKGTFPAISGFITAAARCKMNWLRSLAGESNVYYQAVDSLIVNDTGLSKLTDAGQVAENELGKLRVQQSADACAIFGMNDYIIGNKTAIAGLSTDHESQENGIVMQKRFASKELLFNRRPLSYIMEEKVAWQRVNEYSHRQVLGEGRTFPHSLMPESESTTVSEFSSVG